MSAAAGDGWHEIDNVAVRKAFAALGERVVARKTHRRKVRGKHWVCRSDGRTQRAFVDPIIDGECRVGRADQSACTAVKVKRERHGAAKSCERLFFAELMHQNRTLSGTRLSRPRSRT